MRFIGWSRAILGAVSVCGAVALARAEPIGRAASVVPSADFTRGTIIRTLTIDEALEQDDRIRTSQGGSIQVRFADDTMLTVGPNSEILLDKFIFDGAKAKSLSIEVVRGAMRFVSGTSDHSAYEIKTPVATIGVRGTVVDIGFVNGHWIHNTIDGAITGCLRGTSTCSDFKTGDLAFSIGPNGFISISPSEAQQLFKNLDQTHVNLAHAAGNDPSKPSGAAAGGTGGVGGGTGNPGPGNSNSGPPTDNSNNLGLNGCTSNCAPPPPPPPPPPCTTVACLGIVASPTGTGTGPAFPNFVNLFRVTGAGGDNVIPPDSVVNDNNNLRGTNYIFAQLKNVTWDNDTDLRSITLQSTSNPDDPLKLKITRTTAQIADVTVGTGNVPGLGTVPVYYMASFINGMMSFSDSGTGPPTGTIPTNQSLQLLGWGYTGDLLGTRYTFPGANNIGNQTGFGTVVLFDLEKASTPTWNRPIGANPTTSPAGTFVSGQVAVAIGPTALYYGMTGNVNMPGFGLFNFGTNGGIANPTLSGVVGPLTGDYGRLQSNSFSNTFVNPSGAGAISFCGVQCHADIQFDNIFLQKIGVTYNIFSNQSFNNSDPQISGIATFAQNSAPVASPLPTGIVSFVDTMSGAEIAKKNSASGILENTANGVALKVADLGIADGKRTRVSAAAVDMGSVPGIISWERWTNGTFTRNASPSDTNIPQDAGVSFVYGIPVTYLSVGIPGFTPASFGPSVQFSLIGATIPTISDGSVSTSIAHPAFVGSGGNTTSKLGVDFTNPANIKVGFDMYVQIGVGFGQSFYNFATPGGAANPSASGITVDANGQFSTLGRTRPVVLGGTQVGGVPSCTTGSCTAGVTGFLSGPDATYAGLNYYFGNTSSTLVSGAAVFGRDMPVTEAAAFAFAYTGSDPSFFRGDVGRANSQLVGDATTPSGLSQQAFFFDTQNNNGIGVNFFRDTAVVKEQGTLGGGFSGTGSAVGGILGWERWTSGTVTTCTAQPCDGSIPANTVSRNLNSNQGLHILTGVPATNLPTSDIPVNYVLAGATSPTVANGSVAPGTLQPTSTMTVQFGGTNPNVSANLNVTMNITKTQQENYTVTGTMPLNNVKFDSGGFTLPATSGILCPAPCKGSIGGFLAGPGATGLGIFYQIGTSANSPTLISGAAGFKKQ
jgi:FecR protein